MQKLRQKDLEALASAFLELFTHTHFEGLPRATLASQRRLLPCEISASDQIDPRTEDLPATHDHPPDEAEKVLEKWEQSWEIARALMLARHQVEQLSRAQRSLRQGIAFLDEAWRITWMTDLAKEWLETYFPSERATGGCLPEKLRGWLKGLAAAKHGEAAGQAREPLVISRGNRHLRVRWISDSREDSWLLLCEEDESSAAAAVARQGFTAREAEILHWMAEGKSNPEIGIILGTSPNTVRKHVEHILAKLGVENRTAAVRRFWDMRIAA